jgi:lipopolysaccharide/colanic/teichoic acid biosynthesis glycosyltransferase
MKMKDRQVPIEDIIDKRTLCYNASGLYLLIKRLFDLFASFLLLVLLLPVLLLTAAAVRCESSGPVVLAQERCGYKGKRFKILAFRTFLSGKSSLPVGYTMGGLTILTGIQSNDMNQLSRTGRIIRKFHIDKWLQLLNILKGDMSFVGPHALRPAELDNHAAWYGLGMSAKPGVTGLWHIGAGKTTDLEELIRLDLKYIRERSFIYDMKILVRSCRMYLAGA